MAVVESLKRGPEKLFVRVPSPVAVGTPILWKVRYHGTTTKSSSSCRREQENRKAEDAKREMQNCP